MLKPLVGLRQRLQHALFASALEQNEMLLPKSLP